MFISYVQKFFFSLGVEGFHVQKVQRWQKLSYMVLVSSELVALILE